MGEEGAARAAGLSLPAIFHGIQVADATTAWCHSGLQCDGRTTSLPAPPTSLQLSLSQAVCLLFLPSSTVPPAGSPFSGLPGTLAMASRCALGSDKTSLQPLAPSSLPSGENRRGLHGGTIPSNSRCRGPGPPPRGAHRHLDTQHLRVSWGRRVLGPARTILLREAAMRVAPPSSWQCCLRRPNLAGIFADIQQHPKAPKGLLQDTPAPHLQPDPQSPEVPPALVIPIDLQLLLEAFSTQSMSKDSSCGSKGDAPSPISPHLFSEATTDRGWTVPGLPGVTACPGQSPVTTGRAHKCGELGAPTCPKSQGSW